MKIGFIGNGWRMHGYERVIRQLPDKFQISGVLFRDGEKAEAFEKNNPGLAFRDVDCFLQQKHDMVFILLPRSVVLPYIEKVLAAGFPLLVETPPADGLEQLHQVWALQQRYHGHIQVAEQYFLQPYHQAVQAIATQGVLGNVDHVRVSMAHDYHGISLIRRLLAAGDRPCTVMGQRFVFPVLSHCGRSGMIRDAESMKEDNRKVATFTFDNGKAGFYDFSGEQYFNYFRRRHMTVQGTHGEIDDYSVSYWNGHYPVEEKMVRQDMGQDSNLEGYFHRGITWQGQLVYESPFANQVEARLTDDEIAMGSLLLGMEKMLRTGEEVYPLSDALQDTYLYLLMEESIRTGRAVQTQRQPWHRA